MSATSILASPRSELLVVQVGAPTTSMRSTPGWASLAENGSRARPVAIALLTHQQSSALDDVTASFVLREISPAERALGNITPPNP